MFQILQNMMSAFFNVFGTLLHNYAHKVILWSSQISTGHKISIIHVSVKVYTQVFSSYSLNFSETLKEGLSL